MPDAVDRGETGSDRSSTGAGGAPPTPRGAPSLAILGADALLAAQPATAVQLAHACLHYGFQAVVPASWGDELIAGACLRHVASRRGAGDAGPAIFCACPYVAHRLLAAGPDLEPFLASFVAPPVALARYLRTLYAPTRIRLTYMGRCPGAADDAIDARLTPDELLAVLAERGIDLEEQPRAFDSVIPPDRRRFLSQPGGLPALNILRRAAPGEQVVEVTEADLAIQLTQHLLSGAPVLVDAAARLGCACSGALIGVRPEDAREGVTALEPPRARSPVVDDRVPVPLELPLPAVTRTPIEIGARGARVPSGQGGTREGRASRGQISDPSGDAPATTDTHAPPTPEAGRRKSPTHGVPVRQHSGAVPTTRSGEGRALPRAYVARRGASPRARGPSTPPRGEPAQRREASGGGSAPSGNGGVLRGRERASPPTDAWDPRTTTTAVGAPPDHTTDPYGTPFNVPDDVVEEAARAAAALSAAVAASPSPAAPLEPGPAPELPSEPTLELAPAAPAQPAASTTVEPPTRVPEVGTTSETSSSPKLTHLAVAAVQQRRAVLAALLAVAALSASIGALAGWLAAR